MTDGGAALIPAIYDAALEPSRWSSALRTVAHAFDAVGASYLVFDKQSGGLQSITMVGPCNERRANYLDHYVSADPFASLLRTLPVRQITSLRDCLADDLRRDPWFNECIRPCGVTDIVGSLLFDDGRWSVMFGLHCAEDMPAATRDWLHSFDATLEVLSKAAKLHHDLDRIHWRSTVALHALERIAAGVIVTDSAGRMVDCNSAAQRILQRGDGLVSRNDHVSTRRVFESSKLAKLIAAACERRDVAASDHMLVVRTSGGPAYTVTVTPMSATLSSHEQPRAMILIVDPDGHKPSAQALADLFGFSRAESQLAIALMHGRTLGEAARERGVRITTARTQLSSMLKKVGAQRQADLVRIIAGTQMADIDPKSEV
ncbi:MAG TPA: hypothetical protein VGG27_12705 [Magnetospirillaceae bacterium]|jgi:DNA-binding CsgD family transcriptional regulator